MSCREQCDRACCAAPPVTRRKRHLYIMCPLAPFGAACCAALLACFARLARSQPPLCCGRGMRFAPLLLCFLLLAARHAAADDDEDAYDDEPVQVSVPHLWITHCTFLGAPSWLLCKLCSRSAPSIVSHSKHRSRCSERAGRAPSPPARRRRPSPGWHPPADLARSPARSPLCAPEQVTCGSLIKLQSDKTGHLLHSHEVAYGYGRGSGQQSVTAYPEHDSANSLWIVRSDGVSGGCIQRSAAQLDSPAWLLGGACGVWDKAFASAIVQARCVCIGCAAARIACLPACLPPD